MIIKRIFEIGNYGIGEDEYGYCNIRKEGKENVFTKIDLSIPGKEGLYFVLSQLADELATKIWLNSRIKGDFLKWELEKQKIRKDIIAEIIFQLKDQITNKAKISQIQFPET